LKHVEDSNKRIIEETVHQVGHLPESLFGILHPFNVFQCVLYTNTVTPQGNKTVKQKILNRILLKQEVNLRVKCCSCLVHTMKVCRGVYIIV
jgi:hypothetical protein